MSLYCHQKKGGDDVTAKALYPTQFTVTRNGHKRDRIAREMRAERLVTSSSLESVAVQASSSCRRRESALFWRCRLPNSAMVTATVSATSFNRRTRPCCDVRSLSSVLPAVLVPAAVHVTPSMMCRASSTSSHLRSSFSCACAAFSACAPYPGQIQNNLHGAWRFESSSCRVLFNLSFLQTFFTC